jgi:hypothetical protein
LGVATGPPDAPCGFLSYQPPSSALNALPSAIVGEREPRGETVSTGRDCQKRHVTEVTNASLEPMNPLYSAAHVPPENLKLAGNVALLQISTAV